MVSPHATPHGRTRLRAQDGSLMIEVMVGAALLMLVGLAMFAGFDSASQASATGKSRAIAANLAQQDQERLRTFKIADLSNRFEARVIPVAGVPYMVISQAEWIQNSAGTATCAATPGNADYVRITSTVTWPRMGVARPIRTDSLVAPPNGSFGASQGSLIIQVHNRAGDPQSGIGFTASGPQTANGVTNSFGCVTLGFLQAGSYTISSNQAGYVDRQGRNAIAVPASVIGEATNTVEFDYDRAGQIQVDFDTKIGANPPQPAKADLVSLANTGLAAPGTRVFGTAGSRQPTLVAGNLFPFRDPYGVYAGGCTAADPTNYPGETGSLVTVDPGLAYTATVRVPALNISVTKGGVPVNDARVWVTPTGSGCGPTVSYRTDPTGALPEPGMPYGSYDVCAKDGGKSYRVTGISNDSADGTAVIDFPLSDSGPSCP